MNHRLLFSALLGLEWAIDPERGRALLEILTGEAAEFEAVEKAKARPMDGTDGVRLRDGVAIVDVRGPITRYADSWSAFCGAQSVETLARDFDVALNNPNVGAILLNVDSPGGEVNGISEFADHIYAARGRKPVVAYVGGLGASAAYWIASAADEIVVSDTAMLGSIGVVAAVPNPDATKAKDIEFVSSQSPNKRPNPNTETGRAHIQARIDGLADVFIGAVARNRGAQPEAVVANYGQGGVLIGAQAVQAGLADRLGSFESTLSELAAGRWQRKPKTKPASANTEETEMFSIEEMKAAVKDAVASLMPVKPKADASETVNASELAALQREAAEAKAALAQARKQQAEAEAAAVVGEFVKANQALPAEAEMLKAQYLRAVADDLALPVASGEVTRVAALKASVANRPAHVLTTELVVDDKTKIVGADKGTEGGEVSDARRKELLAATPQGRAALAGKK